MSSDNKDQQQKSQPSTVNAYLNYATGVTQEQTGRIIGNTNLEQAGANLKDAGNRELEEARRLAREQEPDKTRGNYNTLVGGVKEQTGAMFGSADTAQAGAKQRREGEVEHQQATAAEYVSGAQDKTKGFIQQKVGEWTGDDSIAQKGVARKVEGQTKMDYNQ
ncbi:uncharacterized protein VTP21DRAFT_3532 [Calcarisporiella thermophila]|uniref:uncharacterized protein n=1 Tax=Calcarisporiella thermophila TaxID=911321 RepID=UPI0037426F6F